MTSVQIHLLNRKLDGKKLSYNFHVDSFYLANSFFMQSERESTTTVDPRGHSITKHTGLWLEGLSQKPQNICPKTAILKQNAKIIPPKYS